MDVLGGLTRYLSDVVDILIISYIIYRLLLLLRGTRAVQLLKGLTVVLAAWVFSSVFQLSTLQWLIENLFSVGVIVLFIIFQPELRRALEQLGRGGFFGRSRQMEDQLVTKMVGELIKAIGHLSKRRIGALIIIERETGLSDYVESGIRLEAALSAELLINIFLPNTPLHDGAVIVRGDRVAAAGCFLPLTDNPYVSTKMGTRHRAGLGVSEQSDALVVIVSEETGSISFVKAGRIERNLDEDGLRMRLVRELQGALGIGRRGGLG